MQCSRRTFPAGRFPRLAALFSLFLVGSFFASPALAQKKSLLKDSPKIKASLGIAVYVVKSTITDASITLNQIFIGAFPYVIIMLAVTILLIAVPDISLFLLKL